MALLYWVYEDYFIFKPYFNGSISDFIHVIKQYDKLIFSNYQNFDLVIKNELFGHNCHKDASCSKFNKPLLNELDELANLKELTFGWYFNHPLANSLDKLINLKQLIFGYSFNKPLSNSLDQLINLEKIIFGTCFNQLLDNSLL